MALDWVRRGEESASLLYLSHNSRQMLSSLFYKYEKEATQGQGITHKSPQKGKSIQCQNNRTSNTKANSKNSEVEWVPENLCWLGTKPICHLQKGLEWLAPTMN